MVQECDARGRWHQPYLPVLTSQVNLDSSKIVAHREANTNGNLATESMNLRKKYQLKITGKIWFFFENRGMNVDSNLKKSRGNPIIYVTIKTSKEELHNLKLSLNQPTFNNCTTLWETYYKQEISRECLKRMIWSKKTIVQNCLSKRRKEIDKMKVEISRFSRCHIQRLYKCYGNFQRWKTCRWHWWTNWIRNCLTFASDD